MSKILSSAHGWDTSSFGHPPDVSLLERSALGEHLSQCGALRGRLHTLRTGAHGLHGLLAGHVVTTVLVAMLLAAGFSLMR